MMKLFFSLPALILACCLPQWAQAHALVFEVVTTITDGTVPDTNIDYTITSTGTGREIFAPGFSDTGLWFWLNDFPEFVSTGTQTLTVNFSAPVPVSSLVLGVNSISNSVFTLTVSGGTATTNDFDLSDGLAALNATGLTQYDGTSGQFTATAADQSLMIGSTSTNTITQLSITGDNGGDCYTLFFGTASPINPFVPTSVPTLNQAGLIALMFALFGFAAFRLRRETRLG